MLIDKENKQGRVLIYRNPFEMVTEACAFCTAKKGTDRNFDYPRSGSWTGRSFPNWAELEKAFYEPWPEGIKTVQGMLEQLKDTDLPNPKSIKRKQTWNEQEGDVDVDRWLHGDDNIYRRGMRQQTHSISIVSILCKAGDNAGVSAQSIFWRGAAVVAAVDILEQAGYSCEVAMYCRAGGTFCSYPADCFTFVPIKEAGTDLDANLLTNCLSAWIFRNVVLGGFHFMGLNPEDRSYGHSLTDPSPFSKFMNTDSGCIPIEMPDVQHKNSAIKAVKELIEKVVNPEGK